MLSAQPTSATLLPRYVWHMEEPVVRAAARSRCTSSSQAGARSTSRCVLSGEGGDEALRRLPGTYQQSPRARKPEAPGRAPRLTRRGLRLLERRSPLANAAAHYAELAPRNLPRLRPQHATGHTVARRFNRMRGALLRGLTARRTTGHYRADARSSSSAWVRAHPAGVACSTSTRTLGCPTTCCSQADRMTMAASVELRVPLLDHRLLELAFKLPADYKVRGPQLKRVLRHALRGVVPRPILERPKAGFPGSLPTLAAPRAARLRLRHGAVE